MYSHTNMNNKSGNGGSTQSEYSYKVCPYIVKIFNSFQDNENFYIEMEYVEGCTLLSQIRQMNKQVVNNMPFYVAEAL